MAMYKSGLYTDELLKEIDASPITISYNGTTHKSRNLKGWTTPNGYCGGKDFTLHGENYVNAVIQGTYEILLYDGTMTVDLENNLVRTFSGTTCEYSQGHCEDYVYGDIYWNREEHDTKACEPSTYLVLYEGKAVIRSYQATTITAATRVATVTDKAVAFSLIQTEKTLLCNMLAYRTEHPKLFIIELKHGLRFFKKQALHSLDLDLNAYTSSKFIHLERHLGTSIKDMNANVMNKICRLQAQIIDNLQTLAYSDAMGFAYAWRRKPGHNALVRGEVVHILNCVPVQVKVNTVAYCTHELPVVYLNETLYMHPRSHILSRYTENVPCSTLYSVKYRLQGAWYALGPNLIQTQAPAILKTELNFTSWRYKKINIGTTGIYSLADLNRQRSAVLFPIERRAITRQIADTAAGLQTGPQTFDLLALVDENHLKNAIASYWNEFDNSIRLFGTYSGAILGIGFIYRLCTNLCTGTLNGTAVAKMFGKCCGMAACLLPGVAHLALIYGAAEQQRTGRARVSPSAAWRAYKKHGQTRPDGENQIHREVIETEEMQDERNGILV